MDPKPSYGGPLLALSAPCASTPARFPSREEPDPPRPRVDQRLVRPETRDQMVRGRRVEAMPANPPHSDRHFKLDYVVGAHLKEGYVGSTDLLTRASKGSDFATDTCIRRAGLDPTTDTRYLEELIFEVVNEQTPSDVTEKAEELSARGVRRIIAIFVKKGQVCEWSASENQWVELDKNSLFIDETLATPLPVSELFDAAEADNAVARALLAKNNPVIAQSLLEERKAALITGIETACDLLGAELDAEKRSRLLTLDASGLEGLLAQIRAEITAETAR